MTRAVLTLVIVTSSILLATGQSRANDETESLGLLVAALEKSDSAAVQVALLKGMLGGLAGRRNVTAPDAWSRVAAKLAKSEDANVRELVAQLSQIFGDEAATRKHS